MFEADQLCDRIAVIARGRQLALGTPRTLKRQGASLSVVEIEVFGVAPGIVERLGMLGRVESVTVVQRDLLQVVRVHTSAPDATVPQLIAALGTSEVGRVSVREATLEDAYVRLVGGLSE